MARTSSFLASLLAILPLLQSLPGVAAEFDLHQVHNFVTRPELRAPKWNISVYDQINVSEGYWFVAPYERIGQTKPGDGWIGPHIYDQHGELIWSGAAMFGNLSTHDFKIVTAHEKQYMSLIRPEKDTGILMDDQYNIQEIIPIDHFNMHDWNFVDGGERSLALTRQERNASHELSLVTGLEEGECNADFQGIVEFDTKTWQPTWNWTSYGNIGFDDTTFKYGPATDRCKDNWDYLHANAVDKCPDGDFVMSARHADTIYKISRETGKVVWRLGGSAKAKNDFQRGFNFSGQHDVRCRSQNDTHTVISFLDNSKREDPAPTTHPFSRGLIVALDTTAYTAGIETHYDHPDGEGHYAYRRGSMQQMDNGHIFMGWSENSHMSEHHPSGQIIFEARLTASWLGTYRSYKFPFVGRPASPPDIFAQAFNPPQDRSLTITQIWASWNGATEVSSWKVLKTNEKGTAELQLQWVPKAGFETEITYEGYAKYIVVEAVDVNGRTLGRSKIFRTLEPENILTATYAEEELWQQKAAAGVVPTMRMGVLNYSISSFVSGFLCAAVIGTLALCGVFARRNGACVYWRMRLPWHRGTLYEALEERDKEMRGGLMRV